MNAKTKTYIAVLGAVAATTLMLSLLRLDSHDPFRCGGFLLVAVLASTFKVRIPGLEGIYSLNCLVILAGLPELDLAELLLLAAASAITQSYWRAAHRPRAEQIAFNASNLVITAAGAYAAFHSSNVWPEGWQFLSTVIAALVYYLLNTGMTSVVLYMVEGGVFKRVWDHWTLYTLPYYLLGSTLTAAWRFCSERARFQETLLSVLILYAIYRLFRTFVAAQAAPIRRPA